ncbi:DUF924 family protein [Hoeflea prorocentri]|uniref:DUF924 domain-containing protein n=1 Tax=Hoeflea prorocentri TaxID=1922333 RepID=A0A9X3UEW1_9HYPH|nr:DUF924 family protein [Hoeflea prorocentri]MCY6380027.1 DUF924 domain-containing protein [Hoeflea prorocentri]MDA5397827.1 DUF924 domain-containing protein [Hoeflea prorocentri]
MSEVRIENADAVNRFWFDELKPEDWFTKSDELDKDIANRFGATHLSLAGNIPQQWWDSADSVLALVLVFDQFPRNIYRGTPLAFATDCLALKEAKAAIAAGLDQLVDETRRAFFYMPFEHSEELSDQDRAVELFSRLGNEEMLRYAHMHRDVIVRYGRFPHRNAILGRENTAEETTYLAEPGAGF